MRSRSRWSVGQRRNAGYGDKVVTIVYQRFAPHRQGVACDSCMSGLEGCHEWVNRLDAERIPLHQPIRVDMGAAGSGQFGQNLLEFSLGILLAAGG